MGQNSASLRVSGIRKACSLVLMSFFCEVIDSPYRFNVKSKMEQYGLLPCGIGSVVWEP
jgi:hypothetical protein